MDTIASFFCVYEVINHEVLAKLRDDNIDWANNL